MVTTGEEDTSAQEPRSDKKDGLGQAEDFQREAMAGRSSLLSEFWYFLKYNKKWWLLPILILILLMSLFILLGPSGLMPFIYPI